MLVLWDLVLDHSKQHGLINATRPHLSHTRSPLHSRAHAGVGAAPVDGDDVALAASEALEGEKGHEKVVCEFPSQQPAADVPAVSKSQRDMAVTLLEKLCSALPAVARGIDPVSGIYCSI